MCHAPQVYSLSSDNFFYDKLNEVNSNHDSLGRPIVSFLQASNSEAGGLGEVVANDDSMHVAIITLHTDLHSSQVKEKMTLNVSTE